MANNSSPPFPLNGARGRQCGNRYLSLLVAAAALYLLVAILPGAVQAQKLALAKAEVLQMLKGGEAPQQIEALACAART